MPIYNPIQNSDLIQDINIGSRLCNIDPDEAYLDLFAARRLNIATVYPGIKQVETATAAGTVTADPGGNATVTVTSTGMTGSPLAITVALLLNDGANEIAAKIRAALEANATITGKFTVGGKTDKIILTAIAAADNDLLLNVAIAAGTATGVTAAATSANTTAGSLYAIVHPSIRYFQNGWNGYKFWMAYTPYDGSLGIYENPCVSVSNDNVTWTTPPGLTNPIEPAPEVGYNADPCIFMSADGVTMHMVWKYAGGATSITYLRSTTDGVVWSAKVAILTVGIGVEELSPAIVWDGYMWKMWTVKAADTPNQIYVRTSSDLLTWSAPTVCTHSALSTGEPFHLDVHKIGNQYHMLLANSLNTAQYFGVSSDGISWTIGVNPLILDTGYNYKSTMFPMQTTNGFGYGVWLGRFGPASIWYAIMTFDKSIRGLRKNDIGGQNILLAKNLIYPWIFCHTFDGDDSASSTGTSDSGHTAIVPGGMNAFGISGKKAYIAAAAITINIWELGVANFFAEVTIPVVSTVLSGDLIFRYVDASNYWKFGSASGTFALYKVVSGAFVPIALTQIVTPKSYDRFGVECNGNVIKLYINNQLIYTITDAANNAGTKIGLRTGTTTVFFDNLIARTIV